MRMLTEFYLAGLAVIVLVATGCGQDSVTAPAEKPGTTLTAGTTIPRAETVKAASRSFTLSIDLPGASVHGFETTLVEAKVGGYVKTIGQFKDPATGTSKNVDILCLQEIKCVDELFPSERFRQLGYVHQLISGQKGYHGVAILSRMPLTDSRAKAWCQRSDCRHVFATLPGGIELHNVYAPAGGDLPDPDKNPKFAHKLQFFRDMNG